MKTSDLVLTKEPLLCLLDAHAERKEKHGQWTVPSIQIRPHQLPGCNSYKSKFIMLQDLEGSHLRVISLVSCYRWLR
jgi:hypothetical protein